MRDAPIIFLSLAGCLTLTTFVECSGVLNAFQNKFCSFFITKFSYIKWKIFGFFYKTAFPVAILNK